MLRQVDWAWVALGTVETHHERPVDARLAPNRVNSIKPVRQDEPQGRLTIELKPTRPIEAAVRP